MLTFISLVIAFVVGVAVGAYSHKWLAAEAAKAGVDPNSLAAKANASANAAKSVLVVGGVGAALTPGIVPPKK